MAITEESAATPASPLRDATKMRADDFPLRELSSLRPAREPRYQVAISQSVMQDIHAHGKESPEVEVCGILLGTVYHDERGPWCMIDASVRGNFASGKQTAVTITSETWTHVNEVRDRLHPEKKFIGWYHTHPGFGIFLSGMDDFIQENFFAEPWQIALVHDPKSGEDGVFVWREGKTINEPFLVIPENGAPAISSGESQPGGADPKLPSGTLNELMSRLQGAERRARVLLFGLLVLGAIAIIWPLVVFLFVGGSLAKLQPKPADSAPAPNSQPASGGNLPTAVPRPIVHGS